MSEVPALFQLPASWLVALLSEWLDMPMIGAFDTAVTSKMHRSQFLQSLKNMRSTNVSTYEFLNSSFWRWLSIRQVYVETVPTLYCGVVRSHLVISSMQKVATHNIEDEDLWYLVRNCPFLRSLKVTCNMYQNMITATGLKYIADFCHNLDELSFFDPIGVDYQPITEWISIFQQCHNLKRVSLLGGTLQSVNLKELLQFGHLIYELHLYVSPSWNLLDITNLLTNCGNLKKLVCNSSFNKQDSPPLVITAECCPLLEELTLFVVPTGFIDHCKHLIKLSLNIVDLSDSIVCSISGMEKLKDLCFYCCKGLTAVGIAQITNMTLDRLHIVSSPLCFGNVFTVASLRSFAGTNISRTLQSLRIRSKFNDSLVEDLEIADALTTCPNLKDLYLASFDNKWVFGRDDVACLEVLAAGCPLLEDLEIILTAQGLACVGAHCPNLRTYRYTLPYALNDSEKVRNELSILYPHVTWYV